MKFLTPPPPTEFSQLELFEARSRIPLARQCFFNNNPLSIKINFL